MALPKPVVVIFAPLLMASFLQPRTATSAHTTDDDLIRKTCLKTDLRDLCISTIQSDPRSDLKSSLSGFVEIFLQRSLDNAADTYSYIQKLLGGPVDPRTRQMLSDCGGQYGRSITALNSFIASLDFKNYAALSAGVTGVGDGAITCEEVIFGGKSPLTARNNRLNELSILTLAVLNLIQCNHVENCY